MLFKNIKINKSVVLLLSTLAASCSNTSVKDDWMLEDYNKSYKHPMIIGISDSQQTRRIYENHFVEELKKKNIKATPSYTLISSKQKIENGTVVDAVKGTDIDAALVSYLVSSDAEVVYRESPLNTGYSSNVENSMVSETLISNRGRSRSEEVIVLKNDLYDIQTNAIVWSVVTETIAPESIDQVIIDVTELLIEQLFDDNLL